MSGVVKAKITLDLLIPAEDAERFQGMSLSQIQAKVEHANWMAGPVKKSEPTKLGKAELNAELQRFRAAGCEFDEDDVAELAGRDRWWDEIKTLDDMVANKARFLADPGCEFDVEQIEVDLDPLDVIPRGEGFSWIDRVLDHHFDKVVAQFAGKDKVTLHRDMAVKNREVFLEALLHSDDTVSQAISAAEEEINSPAGHWSLSEDTACHNSESVFDDLLLTAEIDAEDIDWFTTFQDAFVRPWEMCVAISGQPRLTSILDKSDGERLDLGESSAPRMG